MLTVARWLAIAFPVSLLAGPAVADIIGILIGLLFLVYTVRQRDFSWAATPWVALLLLTTAIFTISGLLSAEPSSAVRGIIWIRFPLFAAALAFWVLRDELTQRRMLLSMLLAVMFLLFDCALQYMTGRDLFGRAIIAFPTFVRLTGPYSGPRVGLSLVWIAFPVIFYLLDRLRASGWRGARSVLGHAGLLCFIGAVVAVVHFSGERMAFLYCVLGLALAVFLAKGSRRFFFSVAAIGCVALFVLLQLRPIMVEQQVSRARDTIVTLESSTYGRIWQSAARVALDHPLWGVGPKRFRTVCPDPAYGPTTPEDLALRCVMHPHNMYLEMASETGFISLFLFLAAMGLLLHQCWQQRARVMGDAILCGALIAVLIRLWPIASVPSHSAPWFAASMWLVIGLLAARLMGSLPRPRS